jgi:pimeloyl-ACP methyl ester carboxylesterase
VAELHVQHEGPEEAPALLLVHGFLSSNLQWAPNFDALCREFRLAAAELWGHGGSAAPRDPQLYTTAGYAAQFERLRAELGVERWLVCGQSFGAGIAIQYALKHPESVRGLIVTNSRSAFSNVARDSRSSGDLERWESTDFRTLPFHPVHAKRFPEALKQRMVAAADRVEAYAVWQAMQSTAPALSCRDVAGQIETPMLLVNGRFEKVFQPDREFAAREVPGIEVLDLDAGHSVNIEAAAPFNEAVIDFSARCAS